mmetsp:Transcript_5253/g.19250  ORF Transcript_5253/g.19250 Transcript_5253/m.19250 type:complete len:332 (+) Transcript_5253:687-1682(+)
MQVWPCADTAWLAIRCSSCHTGYNKTAGWKMPVGYLLDSGIMPIVNYDSFVDNAAESVDAFFAQQCAPGGPTWNECPGPNTDGAAEPNKDLCDICAGDCGQGTDDYSNYQGAFRCLVEDAGDVAFIKHTTVESYINEEWASDVSVDDFVLLCPSDSAYTANTGSQCAPIAEYEQCYVEKVPAHAAGLTTLVSDEDIHHLEEIIEVATSYPPFVDLFVTEGSNPGNLVFDGDIIDLVPIEPDEVDTPKYIGQDTFNAFEQLQNAENVACTPSAVFGDLNNDGQANVIDVVCNVNLVLNNLSDECENLRADINSDGLVNVLDIVSRVGLILNP